MPLSPCTEEALHHLSSLVAELQPPHGSPVLTPAPHITHPRPGVTVPSLVGGPGAGEGRARELLRVQAVWADLRVILNGSRRENKE